METIIISVGGSIIVPDEIDFQYINKLKKFILSQKYKFILVVGGGALARKYIDAADKLGSSLVEKDKIGIKSTILNAQLVLTAFKEEAYKEVITDPTKKVKTNKNVIIAAGWKPGCSTDYDAVMFAKTYDAKMVINLTNTHYVYSKDPRKYENAKMLKNITWDEMLKIVGTDWVPGSNAPFDPIASKAAKRLKLKVIIANGRKLNNIENLLNDKKFMGTIIE